MRGARRLVLGIVLALVVCSLPTGARGQTLITRDAVARAVGQLDLRPDRHPPETSSDWAAVTQRSSIAMAGTGLAWKDRPATSTRAAPLAPSSARRCPWRRGGSCTLGDLTARGGHCDSGGRCCPDRIFA
jgi:hypothetical protein